MRKLFTSSFSPNHRRAMVRHCAEYMLAGKSFLYLTPSRESMFEARTQLMDVAGSMFNGHVWGFDDLVRAILKGSCRREDVIGRHEISVLVQSVLRSMPVPRPYQDVLEKPGFVQGLCKIISDLKRAGVTADRMMELPLFPLHEEDSAKEKFQFLQNVFIAYQSGMKEGGWLDREDLPHLALAHVSTAECLCGNTLLVLDGFQRLDASRLKLLQRIIHDWPDMDMMANVPYSEPVQPDMSANMSSSFFVPQRPNVIQAGILADLTELGFQYAESMGAASPSSSACIYSRPAFTPPISSMIGHPCRDHEIRETARSIRQLLSTEDVAPQQIAIFCPDAESYRLQLNEVFTGEGIPLDSPRPLPLQGIPLIRDLMALLSLRMEDQYGRSMKNLVASKYLVPLPMLHAMGYETDRLLQAAMKCEGQADPEQWDARFIIELNKCGLFGAYTEAWLDSLHAFHPEKAGDSASAIQVLLEQLAHHDLEEHISILARQGILSAEWLLRDMKALATFRVFLAKTASIWRRLAGRGTDWYPQMVHDLQTLLDATDIGCVSADHAGVRFLSPEMASGQSYHATYLLGMNEGVFPRAVSPPILFTERETALLRRHGIPFSDPEAERLHGQVLFQALLATARNGLHLSWCTATEDGALMNTSPFLEDVVNHASDQARPTLNSKPISMRDRVAAMPRVRTGYPLTAAAMEMEREFSPHRGAFDGKLKNPLLAQQETNFSFSPSQLNRYASCPFTYYTDRVLGLADEDDEPLNAMHIGTFYHDVLRAYHDGSAPVSIGDSQTVSSPASSLPVGNPAEGFDRARLESIFKILVCRLDFSQLPPLAAAFRKSALLKTLAHFLELDATNLSRFKQATGNRLMPILLEQPFEFSFGPAFRLRGIVDRVDLEMDGDHRFTGRYILYDYKKKNLKELKDIVMGEDFQLPLYRTALQSMLVERFGLKNPECLALLYFSIEKLEWKGIVRSDMKTVLFEPRKRPQLLSKENMHVLLKWVEEEAAGVVSRIRDGDFRLPLTCPADARNYDCLYSAICRHDEVRMARRSDIMSEDESRMARRSDMPAKMEEQ